MAKGLGEVFQRALSDSKSGAAPLDAPPSFVKFGPCWLYRIAAIGAGVFGAGAFMTFAGGMSGAIASLIPLGMSVGAIGLALGWLGLLRSDHGGLLPVLGSAAAPIGFEYFRAHVHDRFYWETNIAVLGTCLCVFAGGHVMAHGMSTRVRVVSATAVLSMALTTIGSANHLASAIFDIAGFVAMSSLVGLGVLLAIELTVLGSTARRLAGTGRTSPRT